MTPYIQEGTILIFDEYLMNPKWQEDEFKAFQEWLPDSGWNYSYKGVSFYESGNCSASRPLGALHQKITRHQSLIQNNAPCIEQISALQNHNLFRREWFLSTRILQSPEVTGHHRLTVKILKK